MGGRLVSAGCTVIGDLGCWNLSVAKTTALANGMSVRLVRLVILLNVCWMNPGAEELATGIGEGGEGSCGGSGVTF
jgi:hypothetical protein